MMMTMTVCTGDRDERVSETTVCTSHHSCSL